MFERLITNLQNIFKIPELRVRVFFTLGMLIVFRIGTHIPTPGVDGAALQEFLMRTGGALMGMLNMFSGGALLRFSIFALGIMPYISASIILQLLTVVVPALSKLAKEGEQGRKRIIRYTRFGTIGIALVQGLMIAIGLEGLQNGAFVPEPGWPFRLTTMITVTAGTAFLMWLGEQITERGIGNGISLIIFAGIVANIPSAILNTYQLYEAGQLGQQAGLPSLFTLVMLIVMMLTVVTAIVYMESGRRKVPVQYAKRVVGRRVYGGQSTHIPLKINTAGVIPPIFASSLLLTVNMVMGAGVLQNEWVQVIANHMQPGRFVYTSLYVVLIMFFCFFYTAVMLNPVDMADNLKKYGGFIPGIRPGQKTTDYIYRLLTRITTVGAVYLAIVCVIPEILIAWLGLPFYFGGTSLLIIVGVGLDTSQQIETHMLSRNYEGFLKKSRLKGRSG